MESAHTHNGARSSCTRRLYYVPVNGPDLPKLLAEPIEGALFFVGEVTAMEDNGDCLWCFGIRNPRGQTKRGIKNNELKTESSRTDWHGDRR
jgi:hypothetical protein